jgi:alpha-mannosidase
MHWVDMEWLWGYAALPSSARDMLEFCARTGAKGNINFDGIGYEKLAVEAPEVLAELRAAIASGQIEVVGASYGQPYGLFHGGESNVRQRIYGARAVRRLLGVWPRTFWEEEFDFFPQLPQILRGVGYEYASLFFQWTWHTPHMPVEDAPFVWWEGQDGSRLLTSPRNALDLHQWPEDFAGLLDSPALRNATLPCLVQWLELMPSPDWMCRSELMVPPLQALMNNPDFELRFVTLPEYLELARDQAVPRRYSLDDVFHGMSLSKNGDLFRRLSRRAEHFVLMAESLSALSGFFGRPYPGWDVYPTWELEEAWRELLAAQHHDNDECEGLCGHVGRRSYERSLGLSGHIIERTTRSVARRTPGPSGRQVVFNPLGWPRRAPVVVGGRPRLVEDVPPFGYRVVDGPAAGSAPELAQIEASHDSFTLRRGALSVTVDRAAGVITQLTNPDFPEGALRPGSPLADLCMTRSGQSECFERAEVAVTQNPWGAAVKITRYSRENAAIEINVSLAPEIDAVDMDFEAAALPRPDPRHHAALQTTLAVDLARARLIHDHPYGLSEIKALGSYPRKYPTGDWMTSPQVFEEVRHPFTALQLLDLDDGERGLLVLHDGSQAILLDEPGVARVRNVLSMYDPWDEDYFVAELHAHLRLVPHGPLTHAERWRLAQAFGRPVLVETAASEGAGDLPAAFAGAWCDVPGVAATAFYREQEIAGVNVDHYAGQGMSHPYIVRLVEFDGVATTVRLRVPGPVAVAYRANLLGQAIEPLAPLPAEAPLGGTGEWSELSVPLRPYDIATLYLDLELGRKRSRDLDAYRHVWATLHR